MTDRVRERANSLGTDRCERQRGDLTDSSTCGHEAALFRDVLVTWQSDQFGNCRRGLLPEISQNIAPSALISGCSCLKQPEPGKIVLA
jgi:hypothetical protein